MTKEKRQSCKKRLDTFKEETVLKHLNEHNQAFSGASFEILYAVHPVDI